MKFLFKIFTIVLTISVSAQCPQCPECIEISEFQFYPKDGPNGNPDVTGEFIELVNKCNESIDISCYVVCLTDDNSGGRGECITIPTGTIIAAGDVYVLGGNGTNCSGGVATCDWPSLVLDYNWHQNANEVWSVANNNFYTTNIGNFIGVLRDGGEEITLFDCEGNYKEGVAYENGSGSYTTTENIGAVNGCPSKQITINTALLTTVLPNAPNGGTDDDGWKKNCAGVWEFAEAAVGTSFKRLNPGTGEGCVEQVCILPCDITLIADTDLCIGETITISASTNPNITNPWASSNPSIFDINSSGFGTALSPGSVTVTFTDENDCTKDIEITVHSSPTVSISGDAQICKGEEIPPLTIYFTGTPEWILIINGNSFTISENPYQFSEAIIGDNVITSFGSEFCQGTILNNTATIEEIDFGVSFTADPLEGEVPLEVIFTNTSNDLSLSFNWDFENDGIYDSQQIDAMHVYTTSGVYDATLYAESDLYDCMESYTVPISVISTSSLQMPNVFTPGQDNVNTYFKPISVNMEEEQLTIFNRWGQLIFDENKVGVKWDGTIEGKYAPDGTYFYIYKAKGIDGVAYENKGVKDKNCLQCRGTITLIRDK